MRPGRAADHLPPFSAAVTAEQSYTSTHPLGHTGPLTGSLYLFYNIIIVILLLYLYRARSKIPHLSIPTDAQLKRHRLKFIKNHLKTPTCFGLRPSSGSYNVLVKVTII